MTRVELLFGLASLLPAALNTSPGSHHEALLVRLCTGAASVQTMRLPVGPASLPGSDAPGCCAKGCHSGASRRRGHRRIDPSQ
jgi:hypothetical protein